MDKRTTVQKAKLKKYLMDKRPTDKSQIDKRPIGQKILKEKRSN